MQSTTNTWPIKSQESENPDQCEWKKNVVAIPIQTTPQDLMRTHRKCKQGFYVSHRNYVEKLPEKYTLEPILLRRTGGYNVETSNSNLIQKLMKHLNFNLFTIRGKDVQTCRRWFASILVFC